MNEKTHPRYQLCEDCKQNLCDDCYESDCDCNLANHTLAAALLVYDAMEVVKEEPDFQVVTELPKADLEGAGSAAFFKVSINGRTYQVAVRAYTQGMD
jgi:hypothetical protein